LGCIASLVLHLDAVVVVIVGVVNGFAELIRILDEPIQLIMSVGFHVAVVVGNGCRGARLGGITVLKPCGLAQTVTL
jgi:hypothetical protein